MTVNFKEIKPSGFQAYCANHRVRGPEHRIGTDAPTGAQAYQDALDDCDRLSCVTVFYDKPENHPHDITVEPLPEVYPKQE